MRAFIVLCLIAVTCADKLGYNYRPVGHSPTGLSFTPGALQDSSSNNIPSYGLQGNNGEAPSYNSQPAGPLGSSSNNIPSYAPQDLSSNNINSYAPQGDSGEATNDAPSYAPQPELEKEFYTFRANDDDFDDPAPSNQYANGVKRGLRVIFIKGPENRGLEDAALNLAKQAAEQKTAIYVLTKQPDLRDLANRLNSDNKYNNRKPEVHFIKYRTPEDAANAQKAIRDQYESLGGPSQSYNGGIAPVLNFASKAPAAAPAYAASAPRRSYLPASVLRF